MMRWNNSDMCLTLGKHEYRQGDEIPEAALIPERLAFFMLKGWILEDKKPFLKDDTSQHKRGKGKNR